MNYAAAFSITMKLLERLKPYGFQLRVTPSDELEIQSTDQQTLFKATSPQVMMAWIDGYACSSQRCHPVPSVLHWLTDHPRLPELLPFLRASAYGRDTSGRKTRHRIEFDADRAGRELTEEALLLTARCPHCESPMHPFRRRTSSSRSIYVAVACPGGQSSPCSKGQAAAQAQEDLLALIQNRPTSPVQGTFRW